MILAENAFSVSAGADEVFSALCDVDTVIECLPDTRISGSSNPYSATAEAHIQFDDMRITYRGTLAVVGDDRAMGSVSFRIRAEEVGGDGNLDAIVDVRLREGSGATQISIQGDASATGLVETLSASAITAATDRIFAQFGSALDVHLRNVLPPKRHHSHVSGQVHLVTTEPVVVPHPESPAARIREVIADHRWLIPAIVVGGLGAIVVVRRRR